MNRRWFLKAVGTLCPVIFSGCTRLNQNSFDLEVINHKDRRVKVSVTIKSGGDINYSEEFDIQGGDQSIRRNNIVNPNKHQMIIETAENEKDSQISPQGCTDPVVVIAIQQNDVIDIGGKSC